MWGLGWGGGKYTFFCIFSLKHPKSYQFLLSNQNIATAVKSTLKPVTLTVKKSCCYTTPARKTIGSNNFPKFGMLPWTSICCPIHALRLPWEIYTYISPDQFLIQSLHLVALQNDIPNITQTKKKLTKTRLDMDTVKSR